MSVRHFESYDCGHVSRSLERDATIAQINVSGGFVRSLEWVQLLTDIFGKPGLTWPRRTNKRFAPRALPVGCAFGDKGPVAVGVEPDAWALLAVLNSRGVSYLISLGLGTAEAEGGGDAAGSASNRAAHTPPHTPAPRITVDARGQKTRQSVVRQRLS